MGMKFINAQESLDKESRAIPNDTRFDWTRGGERRVKKSKKCDNFVCVCTFASYMWAFWWWKHNARCGVNIVQFDFRQRARFVSLCVCVRALIYRICVLWLSFTIATWREEFFTICKISFTYLNAFVYIQLKNSKKKSLFISFLFFSLRRMPKW